MRRLGMLGLLALVASCNSDVGSRGLAINDPLDLIDDVQGDLRLFVLDAGMFTCEITTGMVTPAVDDLPEGEFDGAVAELSLPVSGSRAMAEVEVPTGDYVVYVRGKGTDPVSGRTDQFIATACAVSTVESGQTRPVTITLLPITGMGECGDGTLSPDEQCEDANTAAGDGCSDSCRVEPFMVNTTTAGVQNHPQIGGAGNQRFFMGFDSDNSTTLIRALEADASAVMMPAALLTDSDIDIALADISMGAQLLSAFAVHSTGRVGWAFVDFNGGPSDIRVAFTNQDRLPEPPTALVVDGMASNPRIAFDDGGAAMVVYEDMGSSTGLAAQFFASGANTPLLGAPLELGMGAGNAAPAVAGMGNGFVVAFSGGGNVLAQRFGADGSATDAAPIEAGAGAGAQDQATVAAMSDGSFLVAWRDEMLDGAGRGIGFRHFDATGAPTADATALNTTTAGEQGSPSAAANADAYIVVFTSEAGVRGRVIADTGAPIFNREAPPTSADFAISGAGTEPVVAAGGMSSFLAIWTENDDIRGALHPLP